GGAINGERRLADVGKEFDRLLPGFLLADILLAYRLGLAWNRTRPDIDDEGFFRCQRRTNEGEKGKQRERDCDAFHGGVPHFGKESGRRIVTPSCAASKGSLARVQRLRAY